MDGPLQSEVGASTNTGCGNVHIGGSWTHCIISFECFHEIRSLHVDITRSSSLNLHLTWISYASQRKYIIDRYH